MNRARASEILSNFEGKRVIVAGDVMLDEYIWGKAGKISAEAPVIVVEAKRYSHVPGGAANVVNNLCALGATGAVLGVVGDDGAATSLSEALVAEGADISGMVRLADRPTTRKTRIIAQAQQVVRVDHEQRSAIDDATVSRLVDAAERLIATADAVLFSDYQKGVLTPQLRRKVIDLARKAGKPVVGNLKPAAITEACDITVLTLNRYEAGLALGGIVLETDAEILSAGKALVARSGAEYVLITRGSEGLTLFSAASDPIHIPPRLVEVYDEAGAGDTVVSVLTLAFVSGASAHEAVVLANNAAAEVVKKVGVATVSRSEVLSSFDP